MVINYVAKYYSKAEIKIKSFQALTYVILLYVAERNPLLSFVSKFMNKLITEWDYSAQEICHLLLGLLLVEKSCVVISVDCRPKENYTRGIDLAVDEL